MTREERGAPRRDEARREELQRLRLELAALRRERSCAPAGGGDRSASADGRRRIKALLIALAVLLLAAMAYYQQLRKSRPQQAKAGEAAHPAAAKQRSSAGAGSAAPAGAARGQAVSDKLLVTLPIQELPFLQTAALSPSGEEAAVGGGDGRIGLYRLRDGASQWLIPAHRGPVKDLTFTPDGASLVSVGSDGTIAVWAASSGTLRRRLGQGGVPLWSVAASRELVAVAGQEPTIRLYPLAGGEERLLAGHEDWVRAVAFDADGRRLASGGLDTTVRLWEVASGRGLQRLAGHRLWVNAVAFSPDGRLLASAGLERQIVIWELATGQALQRLGGHVREATALSFDSSGRQLASASLDRTVRLWDLRQGKTLHQLGGHRWQVASVDFAPDDSFLLTGSGDGKLRRWPLPPPLPPGEVPLPPPGPGELTLRNNTSGERLRLQLLKGDRLLPEGLAALSRFLKCGTDDAVAPVDPALARLLYQVAEHFGRQHEIQVISGFRSPRYNELRRRQSREVGKESYHLEGQAIDFRLAGVTINALRRYVKQLRAGGVGFYADSQFVHMDTGPVRSWGGE